MSSGSLRFPGFDKLDEALRLPETRARGFVAFLRDEHAHTLLLTAVLGVCFGGVALGIRWLSEFITRLTYGQSADILDAVRNAPAAVRLLVPMAGGVVAGLIMQRAARMSGGVGLSYIMESVTIRRGFVSVRQTLLTAFASVSAMATGGSVGREGPIVSLCSAVGSRLGRMFHLTEMRLRALVAAGAGAGMAAAYNTPVAGTLFVLEVVAGSFSTDLIGPTVVAAVIATVVARIFVWEGPIYEIPEFVLRTPQELLLYAILGLVVGLVSAAFLGLMQFGEKRFQTFKAPRWARTGKIVRVP
jgi:H+/Cl- antiporter ClcA